MCTCTDVHVFLHLKLDSSTGTGLDAIRIFFAYLLNADSSSSYKTTPTMDYIDGYKHGGIYLPVLVLRVSVETWLDL